MAYKKGQGGRPKGAKNKLTISVREAFETAFNELQEDKEHNLLKFAQKYPRDFYQIAAKLIPTSIKADIQGEGIKIIIGKKQA